MSSADVLSYAILGTGLLVLVSLLLNVWRILLGPEITDRILALDTLYINSIALIIFNGFTQWFSAVFRGCVVNRHAGICKYCSTE